MLQLWRSERTGSVELVTSSYAVEEARRNLETFKQQVDLNQLLDHIEIKEPSIESLVLLESISLPEKDRPILIAAIPAGASHLITGDITHFGPLFGKVIEGVMVITPGEYMGEGQKNNHERDQHGNMNNALYLSFTLIG